MNFGELIRSDHKIASIKSLASVTFSNGFL